MSIAAEKALLGSNGEQTTSGEVESVFSKITIRLIPLLFFCYLLNFVDRANIGFAQLQMKSSLGFSDAVYGLGATMFFVGYLIFEVPSNLLLKRIGARMTILRIMVLWGLASAATMFVTTPTQFYIVRLLLGVFEAGFFPGVVLYLTFWFPPQRRAKVMALFMTAQVAAAFVTSPVSGAILKHMHGMYGWEGWQWMFLIEGLPTVLLGVLAYLMLPNGPEQAKWLTQRERQVFQWEMARSGGRQVEARHAFTGVLRDPKVYLLAFAAFVSGCAGYFLAFWTPSIIKDLGVADLQMIGLYAVIPNFFGLIAMVLYGRHADQSNEQRLHYGVAFLVAALGFVSLVFATKAGLTWTLAAIAFGGSALVSSTPIFWAMVTRYLPKEQAPGGIAYINTLASAAGISPAVVGAIKTQTGSLDLAIYLISALFVVAALAVMLGMRSALANSRVAH